MASSSHAGDFATTQWSLVFNAGRGGDEAAHDALATLCRRYWYPLYAYVRRRVGDPAQAQDLTQDFFARVLERGTLGLATPDRGRFRSFLLVAMRNFLSDQWKKERAQKRGGAQVALSLDFERGEAKYHLEPAHELTPDRLFERQWTLSLLELVMERLQQEYAAASKGKHFDVLRDYIAGTADGLDYASAAAQLEMSEPAVRQAASRLRKRYRALLREEVAQTVADPAEVDDELHGLLASLTP